MNDLRLIKIFVLLLVASIKRQISYRTNMIFNGLLTILGVGAGLFSIWVVFTHTQKIAGWTLAETIVLLGTYQFVGGLVNTFIEPNLAFFQGKVTQGEVDDFLLRPVPTVFIASFFTCNPWGFIQVLAGVVVIVLGCIFTKVELTWINILIFTFQIVLGTVIAWSYRVAIASLAFWAPGAEPSIIYDALWQFGRYPISIYPNFLKNLLTFVVPVAFISTYPARSIVHDVKWIYPVESLVVSALAFIAALVIWRTGISRYTSATS